MQNYLEFIGNELKALTSIPSPSGYTKDVAAYLMKTLSDMGYEPQLSNKGNVFVTIGGEGNPLVLAAHVDTSVHGAFCQSKWKTASDYSRWTPVEYR